MTFTWYGHYYPYTVRGASRSASETIASIGTPTSRIVSSTPKSAPWSANSPTKHITPGGSRVTALAPAASRRMRSGGASARSLGPAANPPRYPYTAGACTTSAPLGVIGHALNFQIPWLGLAPRVGRLAPRGTFVR